MTDALRDKLKTLPAEPGVYFHRDANRKIIYVGKAAVLKNRVMSYFQASKHRDPKTRLLVAEITDTEWITVGSEVEALFLESEFIKRYKPKYNIDLRDDKSFIYIKISADEYPVFSYVRRPMDDKAHYFGPYTESDAIRRAMKMLRKIFPYVTHANWPKRGCLQYHLGLCPGPEENTLSAIDYRRDVRRLELYLKGQQGKVMDQLEKEMKTASKQQHYELAATARDQLRDLRAFGKQMIFGDREAFDLSRDQALMGLADRLNLTGAPRRIEAYDISHFQGTDNVASMVVFTDGAANRDEYRRFKMKLDGNDDFEHMREVMRRRFSAKNLEAWTKPDLIIVDGGKGQLGASLGVLDELGISVPAIGLAKREEQIIQRKPRSVGPATAVIPSDNRVAQGTSGRWDNEAWVTTNADWEVIILPPSSHVLQLLQRVRDEAHRFAITYQSVLRGKRQTSSQLDDVPSIGPATRKKLIRVFGSVRGLKAASQDEIAGVVGPAKASAIAEYMAGASEVATPVAADDMVVSET